MRTSKPKRFARMHPMILSRLVACAQVRPTCNEECVGELREMSSVCPVTMAGDAELLPMLSQCQQIEEAAAGAGVNINGECDQSHIDAMHRACCPAGRLRATLAPAALGNIFSSANGFAAI